MLTRAGELQALAELHRQVRREGLVTPTPALALSILAFHIATMFGGLAVCLTVDAIWLQALALLVSTYGALGIGMTGHNASHAAVTGSRRFDHGLMLATMSAIHGISGDYWHKKHVRLHHAAPNHIGIDTDIDLLPIFALSQHEIDSASGWSRRFYRIQHLVFPLAISLNTLNMKQNGIRHLYGELTSAAGRRRPVLWFDLGCLLLHATAFLIVPALFWPVWQVIAFYLLREALNGYFVFASAAPAHFPGEAKFIKDQDAGSVRGQIHTTVNFRTGFWGRLVCLGAEYQIEHHLLPEVNPLKMRRVSEIVEAFCRRNGYPYRQLGWIEGVIKSLRITREPKPVYRLDQLT